MKKRNISLCLLILSSILLSSNLQAQSFLKKLEKIGRSVENAVKDVDKVLQPVDQTTKTEATKTTTQVQVVEKPVDSPAVAKVETVPAKPDNILTDIVKGNVKSITETNTWKGIPTKNIYSFNENRQVTAISLSSYDGKAKLKLEFEYNPDGSLKKRIYSTSGNADWEDILSIDEEPSPLKLNYSSISGTNNEESVYTYANGKLSAEETVTKNGKFEQKNYNNAGKIVLHKSNMSGENITIQYRYNTKGQLIEKKENGIVQSIDDEDDQYHGGDDQRDAKGRIIQMHDGFWTYTYAYNVNGYLSKRELLYRDGDKVMSYSGYLYDTKKNWTKRIVKRVTDGYLGDANMTITSVRKIIYYTEAELTTTNTSAVATVLPINSLTNLSDWDVMGLKGKVKSIKYSTNPKIISFKTDGFHTDDRRFITTKRFQVGGTDGYTWDIATTNKSLIYKGIEGLSISYHFDKYRRIIEQVEVSYSPLEAKYFYKSDADPFPYKRVKSAYWEDGYSEEIYEYEYLTTDAKGNWTKRKVSVTKTTSESDINGNNKKVTTSPVKTYIETATITYYPN